MFINQQAYFMNKLLYVLFISIFSLEFLSLQIGLLSRYITWLPELLSMLTMLIILARVTVGYGEKFSPICGFFLILFLSNIIIGVMVNHMSAGPLIAGIRTYLKFIPFFILPFVYHFSSHQISNQLKLLLFLFIIQAPISLYQRLVLSKGLLTGDLVRGTLATSGQLTVILVCAIAILMTFYLAKRISLRSFIIIFSLLFLPMTLNETKSTIIFLPIAVVLPIFLSSTEIKLRQVFPIILLIILAGTVFVFIYDYFMRPKWGYGIIDFLFMEGRAEGYLYKGDDAINDYEHMGRFDSYFFAIKELSENVLNLFFGFGIGNVSESFLPGLSGEYAEKYSIYNVKMTAFTLILWELGIIGGILHFVLFFMSFKYSRRLSKHNSFLGSLSGGWCVVSLLMMISILYNNSILENAIGYLFWYLSGYIISAHFDYNSQNTSGRAGGLKCEPLKAD